MFPDCSFHSCRWRGWEEKNNWKGERTAFQISGCGILTVILSHFPVFFSEQIAWKTVVKDMSPVSPSQCQGEKLLAKTFWPFWCKVLVPLFTSACSICMVKLLSDLWFYHAPSLMPRAATSCTRQWGWAPRVLQSFFSSSFTHTPTNLSACGHNISGPRKSTFPSQRCNMLCMSHVFSSLCLGVPGLDHTWGKTAALRLGAMLP